MATVIDVAKKAGVSVATVSRVMNSNHIVTKEKTEKVLRAMEEVNYQPRTTPRNSKIVEKKIILLLATAMIEELLSGIYDAAEELNYEVMISYCTKNKRSIETIDAFRNNSVSGVIVLNALLNTDELIGIGLKVPLVQCLQAKEITDTFLVAIDDEKAAYDSVKRIIQSGKKRIGFIGLAGNEEQVPYFSNERYRGYLRALDEFNLNFDDELIKYCDMSYESGLDIANEFLNMKEKPDAVFSVQDTMAVACINAFQEAGFSIPNDIAVSGFDNFEISQISRPKLTTVEQPFYEIGFETIKMIDSMINGNISTGRRLLISHKLIERESTLGEIK